MKAGKEHRVPLSGRALAIIEELKAQRVNDHEFVFPGARPRKPLSNMAMLKVLQRMGRADLTAHPLLARPAVERASGGFELTRRTARAAISARS